MSWSRTIRWLLLIAAVGTAGYFGWDQYSRARARQAQAAQKAPASNPVPVKIATVGKADFPVYLTGLGTVQGFNTVLVRSRVDGQINKIDFTEGQFVKEGDTLVEIDPRPFQASLDQAKAKKAQDEANLANARLDLQRYTRLGEFATKQQTDTQRSQVAQLTAQIEADQAAIDNAQTQLDYATVKAPISGVVGIRQVDVGNIVNASTQTGIVSIAQVEPIAVIFTAPEEQLPDIRAALAEAPRHFFLHIVDVDGGFVQVQVALGDALLDELDALVGIDQYHEAAVADLSIGRNYFQPVVIGSRQRRRIGITERLQTTDGIGENTM